MKTNEKLLRKYRTKVVKTPSKPGCWDVLTVEIYQHDPNLPIVDDGEPIDKGVKIGEYGRNYPSLFDTFHPFVQDGKEYALYSKDYTATRVMSLPDCKDICGEERNSWGFCPVEYVVPYSSDECGCDKFPCEYCGRKEKGEDLFNGQFGFLSGCIWGDDTSWKVQHLDLSDLKNGNIKREEWMGYVELPRGGDLKDAIDLSAWERDDHLIGISGVKWYRDKKATDTHEAQIQRLEAGWREAHDKLSKFEDSRLHCLKQAFRLPRLLRG